MRWSQKILILSLHEGMTAKHTHAQSDHMTARQREGFNREDGHIQCFSFDFEAFYCRPITDGGTILCLNEFVLLAHRPPSLSTSFYLGGKRVLKWVVFCSCTDENKVHLIHWCVVHALTMSSDIRHKVANKLLLCLGWGNISLSVVIGQVKITIITMNFLIFFFWMWVRSCETTMCPPGPPDTTNPWAKKHRILGVKSDFRSNSWWLQSAAPPLPGNYLKFWNKHVDHKSTGLCCECGP